MNVYREVYSAAGSGIEFKFVNPVYLHGDLLWERKVTYTLEEAKNKLEFLTGEEIEIKL